MDEFVSNSWMDTPGTIDSMLVQVDTSHIPVLVLSCSIDKDTHVTTNIQYLTNFNTLIFDVIYNW